jgi:hypothetical protein
MSTCSDNATTNYSLITFINSELSGLKTKQATVLEQIQTMQKELQRLSDTNLVINGAIQSLTHVIDHYKTNVLTTSSSSQEASLPVRTLLLDQGETSKLASAS